MAAAHGGFDANFVEPLSDRLTCPICRSAPREPRITECGHQFCLECLRPLIRNAAVLCPICRTELKETEIYPNNMVKREILSLKIKCDNQEEGCEWTGELRQQDEHKQTCGYVVVPCDNKCEEMVMRKDKNHHEENLCYRRIVSCSYCDVQLEYQEVVSVHFESCVRFPVGCHYGCGMQIPRGDMDVHTSREGICSKSPLQCDFADAGCQFSGNRMQLEDHLRQSTVSHLNLAMGSLHTTTRMLAASDKRHKELAKKLAATEAMLTRRESEFECVKAFLALEFKSSQTLDVLMKDGVEKAMESAEFLRSVLADKHEFSVELSGIFYNVWETKATVRKLGSRFSPFTKKFYTGHPGWLLKLCCQNAVQGEDCLSIMAFLLNGQYDDQLPQSCATLCITLVNQQAGRNIEIKSECQLTRGLGSVRSGSFVENYEDRKFLYRFQFSRDDIIQCWKNGEILLKFQFKPL